MAEPVTRQAPDPTRPLSSIRWRGLKPRPAPEPNRGDRREKLPVRRLRSW